MDGRDHKPLPSSDTSEQIILGAILLDNDLMAGVADSIGPEVFYHPLHRRVFAAMLELHASSKPTDPALIAEILKAEGSLDAIGGLSGVTNLTYGLPHFSNVDEYIEIVRRKANLRQLIRTCSNISRAAEDDDYEAVFKQAQSQINDLCMQAESGETSGYFMSLEQIVDTQVMQALDDLRHGTSAKIKTGFSAIDNAIGGGIAPSDVVLVAADTGKGKSAFALQMAHNFAKQGYPSAFLAGEMTNQENVFRLVSQVSGITNLNWKMHLNETEYEHSRAWAQHIKADKIYFEHRISDLQTLAVHLRSLVRRNAVKVLVIDYIQLFKMERMDKRQRNERIAEASQEVKRLANELGIAIIEVAQFNREGAKSAEPGLHDLEGSGQLEKDASLIFLLDITEDEFADSTGLKYHEAKVRIVKGRNVGKGKVEGRFYGRSIQFNFDL